jgi:cytochrome P450
MKIVTDPPRHGAIRQVLAPVFAPRAARRWQARIDEIAADVVARILEAEAPVDFATEVTALPAFTVCDLLGVPTADWGEISRLTATAFGAKQSGGIDGDAEKVVAHTELFAYLDDLARAKRKEPGEDIVSRLVAGPADGEPFSDDEILLNCEGVINGGVETTRHAASRGILGFLRNPAQWSRLRSEPQLSSAAVEEVLRWATPPLMVMRHATRDVSIADVPIAAGEPIVVCNAAANRDPAVFPDPEAMLIDRHPNRHLSFGLGPHFCIGAALARMELSALFGALSGRVRAIEEAGEVRHLRSNFIWGVSSLPVILHCADD